MELYFHDAELYFAIGHADAVEFTRVTARQLLDFAKGSAGLDGTEHTNGELVGGDGLGNGDVDIAERGIGEPLP